MLGSADMNKGFASRYNPGVPQTGTPKYPDNYIVMSVYWCTYWKAHLYLLGKACLESNIQSGRQLSNQKYYQNSQAKTCFRQEDLTRIKQ
jgi:hypothetical protein